MTTDNDSTTNDDSTTKIPRAARKATAVGAVMLAAGAIVTGASITSGAMAAADDDRGAELSTVVGVAAATDGDAYQCSFDDVTIPNFGDEVIPRIDGAGAVTVVAGTASATAASGEAPPAGVEPGQVFEGTIEMPAGAELPLITLGGDSGLVESGGVAPTPAGGVIDASTLVAVMEAGGDAAPMSVGDVRDGTADECDALRQQMVDGIAQAGIEP